MIYWCCRLVVRGEQPQQYAKVYCAPWFDNLSLARPFLAGRVGLTCPPKPMHPFPLRSLTSGSALSCWNCWKLFLITYSMLCWLPSRRRSMFSIV